MNPRPTRKKAASAAAPTRRESPPIRAILNRLKKAFPEPECALEHDHPLHLLVATILSAQCTDKRVNLVTPALFARYPTAADYAGADSAELEDWIRSTGFFRNKAKSILGLGKALVARHDGEVPDTMEELFALPGVGRKTANVVLGTWFGKPAIPVDTHVTRLSNRLGLTKLTDPVKIEYALQELTPKKDWTFLSHALIWHGRRVCQARRPDCDACTFRSFCPRIGV